MSTQEMDVDTITTLVFTIIMPISILMAGYVCLHGLEEQQNRTYYVDYEGDVHYI